MGISDGILLSITSDLGARVWAFKGGVVGGFDHSRMNPFLVNFG